jgi:hypothetical protein
MQLRARERDQSHRPAGIEQGQWQGQRQYYLQVPISRYQKVVALDVAVHDGRLATVQVHHARRSLRRLRYILHSPQRFGNNMTMYLCSELEAAAPGQLGGVSLRPPQHVPQAAALHEPEQGRNVRAMQ